MSTEKMIKPAAIGARYGALAGLICILIVLTLYLINPRMIFEIWGFTGFAVIVLLKIWSVFYLVKLKKYIEFKEGLQCAFMVSVVSLFLWIAFASLLIGVFDTTLIETQKEVIIERVQNSNLSPDKMKEALESIKTENFTLTFSKAAILYALTLFVGFIYAMVTSGLFHYLSTKNRIQIKASAN